MNLQEERKENWMIGNKVIWKNDVLYNRPIDKKYKKGFSEGIKKSNLEIYKKGFSKKIWKKGNPLKSIKNEALYQENQKKCLEKGTLLLERRD